MLHPDIQKMIPKTSICIAGLNGLFDKLTILDSEWSEWPKFLWVLAIFSVIGLILLVCLHFLKNKQTKKKLTCSAKKSALVSERPVKKKKKKGFQHLLLCSMDCQSYGGQKNWLIRLTWLLRNRSHENVEGGQECVMLGSAYSKAHF